ncbi:MAG: hypothetical protein Q9187_005110 [Circinaria calcarea]
MAECIPALNATSDLLVQGLTNLRQAEAESSYDKQRSSGAISRGHSDRAFLGSLHSRWNPRTPKPTLATETQTRRISGGPGQVKSKELVIVDETLSALNEYEKHSAKVMERYYSASERMKQGPIETAVPKVETVAPKLEQTVSYDASRDPRLRR